MYNDTGDAINFAPKNVTDRYIFLATCNNISLYNCPITTLTNLEIQNYSNEKGMYFEFN